ncbi:hypothetical protein P872_10030 [Rhodonellum psychrophilum GCM71 = DSM 17998]|uniref:Peptidase M1 membrane alanine aminopeptidase domain-containing protein n=3 Tax=Rhodonellum TaxID=336827 RepID=U5BXD8_9BACT|nr:hypothetical protein [Rhodonellum ikkaensis]ERM81281.1 hypothetical protein P872_10030 [Rhodonellum psychrophilum GCM71 = DSM 17998]SDZ54384.1 hypothetical protein SAMN05444412_12232 [Rhodonellum ikkaensis]
MKFTSILLIFLGFLTPIVGFSQIHLEGEVRILMKEGLIDCSFELSNVPEIEAYNILLNKGMNIQFFQNTEKQVIPYSGYYNGRMRGEALAYTFIDENRQLEPMPKKFSIKYRGAFPVYEDLLNSFDYKGMIAFNGKTLRAAEQSKWYPVIYDVAKDKLLDAFSYSIKVICEDCAQVFINGDVPSAARDHVFQSSVPRQPMLFAGEFPVLENKGNYILNVNLEEDKANMIFKEIDKIKLFFAGKMQIPYNEKIFLISHKAVTPYKPDQTWGFAIFPTFAYSGVDFNALINGGGKLEPSNLSFFAHELAHYYFDTKILSGPQAWFWLESTAEYLALKAVEEFSPEFYQNRIKGYANFLSGKNYKALAKIKKRDEIDEDYRYVFGPLLLLVFELEFGNSITFQILSELVKRSELASISLDDFKEIALEKGVSLLEYSRFEEKFLNSSEALTHTVEKILSHE